MMRWIVACAFAMALAVPLGSEANAAYTRKELHRPGDAGSGPDDLDLQRQPEVLLRLAAAQGHLPQPLLLSIGFQMSVISNQVSEVGTEQFRSLISET